MSNFPVEHRTDIDEEDGDIALDMAPVYEAVTATVLEAVKRNMALNQVSARLCMVEGEKGAEVGLYVAAAHNDGFDADYMFDCEISLRQVFLDDWHNLTAADARTAIAGLEEMIRLLSCAIEQEEMRA